jgi:hypothetical protein
MLLGKQVRNTRNTTGIERHLLQGLDADLSTNSGYSTYYLRYTPGYLDVFANGAKLIPDQQFIADNGTDVQISFTINPTDVVEIIGYSIQNDQFLNMSSVQIVDGSIGGVDVKTLKSTIEDLQNRVSALEGN